MRELGLRVTERGNMRLAGVPINYFTEWAKKLLAKGYKVGRVDEVETKVALAKRKRSGEVYRGDGLLLDNKLDDGAAEPHPIEELANLCETCAAESTGEGTESSGNGRYARGSAMSLNVARRASRHRTHNLDACASRHKHTRRRVLDAPRETTH